MVMTEKLTGYDVVVVLGAPIFTYHVHTEGPFVPEGTRLYQIIDDPQAAAWTPVGSSLLSTMRLGIMQLLELITPRGGPRGVGYAHSSVRWRRAIPSPARS